MATFTDWPALWDGGQTWGTSETGEEAYWHSANIAADFNITTGKPELRIAINGSNQTGALQSAEWTYGKDGWFAPYSSNSASFGFSGDVSAAVASTVVVYYQRGPLYSGYVDTRSITLENSQYFWTNITTTDVYGLLGQAALEGVTTTGANPTVSEVLEQVYAQMGWAVDVWSPNDSTDQIPAFIYSGDFSGYISKLEQAVNASVTNSRWGPVVCERDPFFWMQGYELTGYDAPASWVESEKITDIINDWNIASDTTTYLDTSDTTSIEAYGQHSYVISEYQNDNADPYTQYQMIETLAVPRPVVDSIAISVSDVSQGALNIDPFTMLKESDGTVWQALSVSHSVTPSEWKVSVVAEQPSDVLNGLPTPKFSVAPTYPSLFAWETVTASADATVMIDGATAMGAGLDPVIPVGHNAGDQYRGLIKFDLPDMSAVTVTGLAAAFLEMEISPATRLPAGTTPQIIISRVTENWTPGTADGTPYSAANAVIWPGPSCASTGDVNSVAAMMNSATDHWFFDITDIAKEWVENAEPNYGLRLASYNEDLGTYNIEFISSDDGVKGVDAFYAHLVYEYQE